jgi:acyl carrier protein
MTQTKTVLEILSEIRPEFDFTASSDLIDEGLLDSLDMVTLVAELDGAYGISISGIDIVPENFSSVEQIEALVERYRPKS